MTTKALSLICIAAVLTGAASAQEMVKSDRRLKLRVAVAPLDYGDYYHVGAWQIPVEFRNAIDEKLTKKLLDTGKFVVLERKELDDILQEKAIKEENTGQSQKGKIVSAQALVKGKLTDFSMASKGAGGGINIGGIGRVGGSATNAKCSINVRIFNVDTSELIASEDASGTASSTSFKFSGNSKVNFADFGAFQNSPLGEATTKAIDGAVQKIVEKLSAQPWSARVADFDAPSKEVSINAGSDSGLIVGDVFEVHRVSRVIKDPDTGEVLSVRTSKIGTVKVTEVERKVAFASVVEGTGFQAGDIIREIRG